MTSTMATRWMALVAVMAAALVSGCNTMEGAGKDVERAGEKIQSANCSSADAAAKDPACR